MADTFRLLLRDYPKTAAAAEANYWIGWAAFDAKDYRNAIAPLKAAREGDREQFLDRATLRILLAHYYLEERDALAKEVDTYTREAPKSKVPDEVLRWLGGQFLHDKKYEVAGKYFAALTQRDADAAPDDWLNLGRSELEQGKFEDAVGSLRTFLEKAKQPYAQATGQVALGQALLGLRKFDEAQKAADQACSLQPEGKLNALGRTLSGDIAAARGRYPEAAKIYLSISVILDDPEITPRALEKAWQALNKAGDEKQAAKTLNDLQSRYPEFQVKPAKVP
jgi:TolA-binding protein